MIQQVFMIALLILVLAPVTSTFGNNNLFLPGDSYFPTILTEEDLARLSQEQASDRIYEYSSFGGYAMAFCGNAGFRHTRFGAVDDRFIANLQNVYRKVREWQPRELREENEDGKKRVVETNGIRVLFYRSDFPFPGGQLGLRYNENWASEAVRFGHQRTHLRLCCLIRHPDAVALSWRDATSYPGLTIQPSDAMHKEIRDSDDIVTVTDDVKAFVISSYDLEDFFQPAKRFLRLYTVDSDGFKELHFDGEQWGLPDDAIPF